MNAINYEANVSKNFLLKKKNDQEFWLLGDQKCKNRFNEMCNICILVFEKFSLGSFQYPWKLTDLGVRDLMRINKY